MEKKFSEAFDDEILDSKKPAGCIGGIFQLFDCQQLLGGKHLSEQGNRRGPSANAPVSPRISLSCKLDKNQSRSQDNSRYSMESSRTSFSSTFTSFSSLEHKSPQERPICTHHSFFSGRSPRNSISSPRTSATEINKFPAFKEIIKESIYKDLCSPIIKEDDNKSNKELKTIHSPRPMDSSKVNDLEESLRIVLKLKGSPRSVYDGHSTRFSYDGKEASQAYINVKQYSKHGGLSRLSLDSREGSPRCNLSPTFNNSTMKEFDKNRDKRVPATLHRLQDLARKEKNSSIVAKLMGLEPLNSDTKNNIRCYDPFNEHDNQIVGNERKQEKPVQSPRNIARPPRRSNPHLDSPSKFSKEETPQMARGYVDENMKEKIKSVFNEGEKRLQKLQFRHFNKELQNLKRVIIEAKKIGTKNLSSVNSLSTQLTPTNYRSSKVFKTPIVVMEPARKLDVSFSEVTNLEGLPALGKIRTSDSESNRKKGFANTQTNAEQTFTENKAKCRGPHSLSKIQDERAVNNTVSPRLQQIKPELKMKASASIPNYDTSKSPRRAVNSQLLDSVSPISKLRNKSNKVQDIELQKSRMQVNVEPTRAKNSIEVKPLPSEKSIQNLSVKGSTGVALVSDAKKHPAILEDISAKEIILVSPRLSSHKSVPDALLKQDGFLHSPESVLKVFKEYQNLLPDRCNFTMERPPPTDSKISKSMNEACVPNATIFKLVNQDRDNRVVAETFPVCALPRGESDLLSMLDQNTTDKSSEFVQTSNLQKLHQKLIFDVVNEILAQKMDASSSGGRFHHILHSRSSSFKQLYKELCSEIKCLQSCKEENLDDNSMIHKDANWHSQLWNRFECEIPVLVLEIERLIFKDLINEVVNGL